MEAEMGVKRLMGIAGFHLFADEFKDRFVVATLQDAVNKAKFYKAREEKSVINILGEHAKTTREAEKFCDQIVELITLLKWERLKDVHIAYKPTQIGLDVSEGLYRDNKALILKTAELYLPGALMEEDAEDHFYREPVFKTTIEFSKFSPNQLLCCQLNRPESIQEIKLLRYYGVPMRICKGNAYKGDITKESDLRRMFLTALPIVISRQKTSAVATHDLFLIDAIVKEFNHCKDKFEFELLMGIEENLYKEPYLQGFTFRRYIPCDPNNQWEPYAKRRAEAIVNIWLRNWWYKKLMEGGREKWKKKNLEYYLRSPRRSLMKSAGF